MEVFHTYKGFTWISIDKLFVRDANIKRTTGNTLRVESSFDRQDMTSY